MMSESHTARIPKNAATGLFDSAVKPAKIWYTQGGRVYLTEEGEKALKERYGWATSFLDTEKALEETTGRRKVLEEAMTLTHGDRDKNYGDPYVNHKRIAELWSTYLDHNITPEQVAVCMALLKVARLAHQPGHRDSFVDGAAYLAIAAEMFERGN